MKPKLLFILGLPFISLFSPSPGKSQIQELQGVLFPWEMPGITYEFRGQNQAELMQSWNTLKQLYIPMSKTLYEYGNEKARFFTANQRLKSEGIAVSIGTNLNNLKDPIYLQPILCPINGELMVAILAGHLDSGKILDLALAHLKVSTRNPKDLMQPGILAEAMRVLWNRIRISEWSNPPEHRLKVALNLRRGSEDSQAGTDICPTLILAKSLTPLAPTTMAIGLEHLNHLRQILGAKEPLMKANRVLNLEWEIPNTKVADSPRSRWKLKAGISENVFGRKITPLQSFDLSLRSDFSFQLDERLENWLVTESQKLKIQDWPMVSKQYGAWVYLDRGRAWGLKMKDRLILSKENGDRIKGHVVGFFGPELNIHSPRGYWITEGAILFVRKGQRDIELGQIFQFDPTEFPTPWPPVSQPITP